MVKRHVVSDFTWCGNVESDSLSEDKNLTPDVIEKYARAIIGAFQPELTIVKLHGITDVKKLEDEETPTLASDYRWMVDFSVEFDIDDKNKKDWWDCMSARIFDFLYVIPSFEKGDNWSNSNVTVDGVDLWRLED